MGMALILTPGQFNDRADFYHQAVSLLGAGFGLIETLEHLRDRPPSRSFIRPLTEIVFHLREGETFARAIALEGKWVPEFDAALLEAGELSGRLDHCMGQLESYYIDKAELLKSTIASLIYPVALLHALVFLNAAPGLVLSYLNNELSVGVPVFLAKTFGVLIPIYAVVLILIYFFQSGRARIIRKLMERIFSFIPIVGTARAHLALSRLAMSLGALLNAGVIVTKSWLVSASSSGSFRLDREISTWPEKIDSGVPPSELIRNARAFPSVFANLYTTGEASGRLDDHLQKLHVYYADSGKSKLRKAVVFYTSVFLAAVMLYIAYYIISFYVGYFKQVGELTDF